MSLYRARPGDGTAWITGASSGIGRALALELAASGYTVIATARDAARLAAVAEEAKGLAGRIVPMPGDVTDAGAMAKVVDAAVAEFGAISLAVLNAGIYTRARGDGLVVSRFEKTFAVNLMGVVNCLVPVVEVMKASRRGQVALMSSVAGFGGIPTSAAYGASKAALINMAESLKFDLDKLDIRIQVINPGFVETPATEMNSAAMPALMDAGEAAARIARGLRRGGFQIAFPRRLVWPAKLVGLLPYSLYFPLLAAVTGWRRRPADTRPRQRRPHGR
jgi:Short-chain dehydrogenases of various substrate specificities